MEKKSYKFSHPSHPFLFSAPAESDRLQSPTNVPSLEKEIFQTKGKIFLVEFVVTVLEQINKGQRKALFWKEHILEKNATLSN